MSATQCKRCGNREDELHLFLSCPFAQKVWELSPLRLQLNAGTFPDFPSLLTASLRATALPPIGISLSPLAPWIMWNLWKARNYLLFEDMSFSEQDVILKCLREATEWQSAQVTTPCQPKRATPRLPRLVSSDTFKCYVDAAWCGTTRVCGQGWTVVDPRGNAPLRYSTSRCFVQSALTAEALAMRSALFSLCCNPDLAHVQRLEVFSDSLCLITTINSKASSKELKAIIHDITCFSESFISISFNFVPRLGNIEADVLSKSALVAAKSSSYLGV